MNPSGERKREEKSDDGSWLAFLPVWLGGTDTSRAKAQGDSGGEVPPHDADGADGGDAGGGDGGGGDGGGGGGD